MQSHHDEELEPETVGGEKPRQTAPQCGNALCGEAECTPTDDEEERHGD